jgi:predicted AAA+ superfamily ATPase
VDSYIKHIEDAKLIYRARRMDSKTKEYLQTSDKFYATDVGMRNVSVGYTDRDLDDILENLVFMELMFRFGNASVMSVDGKEIDFVSFDGKGEPRYFQVSLDILNSETMKREITPLKDISDNYPKYIITMDRYPYDNVDGIKIVNIMDFLVN